MNGEGNLEVKKIDDKTVENQLLSIRKSKIGNAIPIALNRITLRNLHLVVLIVKSALVVPTVMITYQGTEPNRLLSILSYILYAFVLLDTIASYLEYYKLLTAPALVRMLAPICKVTCLLVVLIATAASLRAVTYWLLALSYLVINIAVETLYLFYSELDRIDNKHGLVSAGIAAEEKLGLLGVDGKDTAEAVAAIGDEENRFTREV